MIQWLSSHHVVLWTNPSFFCIWRFFWRYGLKVPTMPRFVFLSAPCNDFCCRWLVLLLFVQLAKAFQWLLWSAFVCFVRFVSTKTKDDEESKQRFKSFGDGNNVALEYSFMPYSIIMLSITGTIVLHITFLICFCFTECLD